MHHQAINVLKQAFWYLMWVQSFLIKCSGSIKTSDVYNFNSIW